MLALFPSPVRKHLHRQFPRQRQDFGHMKSTLKYPTIVVNNTHSGSAHFLRTRTIFSTPQPRCGTTVMQNSDCESGCVFHGGTLQGLDTSISWHHVAHALIECPVANTLCLAPPSKQLPARAASTKYRLTVAPPQRPMAVTTCSGTQLPRLGRHSRATCVCQKVGRQVDRIGICYRAADALMAATMVSLVQTATNCERDTGIMKLGSEGNDAAPFPCLSCFEHQEKRMILRRTVSVETSSQQKPLLFRFSQVATRRR